MQDPTPGELLQTKACRMLLQDEKARPKPYDDATGKNLVAPSGNVTIGIGHNCDSKPLSMNAMLFICREDIAEAEAVARTIVGDLCWQTLSVNRKCALINLAFSCGGPGLSQFKRMISAIKVGNFSAAGGELRSSLWSSQVDPKRLPDSGRDDRVISLLENDIYEY